MYTATRIGALQKPTIRCICDIYFLKGCKLLLNSARDVFFLHLTSDCVSEISFQYHYKIKNRRSQMKIHYY